MKEYIQSNPSPCLEKFDAACRSNVFTRFVLIAGLAICLLAAITSGHMCPDGSCFVYASEKAYGGLLYYLGAVLFGLLIAVQLKVPHKFALASLVALAMDLPLLLVQTAYLPCTICLLITTCLLLNALIAGEAYLQRHRDTLLGRGAVVLLLLSGILLGHNTLTLGKTSMEGQSLNATAKRDARLFFAPSDRKQLAHVLEMYHAVQGEAQLLPVSENPADLYAALLLKQKLVEGTPFEPATQEALRETALASADGRTGMLSGPEGSSFFHVLKMRFALLHNASLLENIGGHGLPSLQVGDGPLCWGKANSALQTIPFNN